METQPSKGMTFWQFYQMSSSDVCIINICPNFNCVSRNLQYLGVVSPKVSHSILYAPLPLYWGCRNSWARELSKGNLWRGKPVGSFDLYFKKMVVCLRGKYSWFSTMLQGDDVGWQYNICIFFCRICIKIKLSSQWRGRLVFFPANMAAMTSLNL